MREGRVELPRPFGHRILRLLRPGTDLGSTCRPVPSGVVLCPSVSARCEQDVGRNYRRRFARHVYVERYPQIGMVGGLNDGGFTRPAQEARDLAGRVLSSLRSV